MKKTATVFLVTFSACIFLTDGCAVGPDYKRPANIIDSTDKYGNFDYKDASDANNISPGCKWWQSFADETTNQMVKQALANNYQLKAAAARVIQAQAVMEQAAGRQMPQINYNLSRTRAKSEMMNMTTLATDYAHGVSVSYVLDIFGKLKSSHQGLWQNYLASKAAHQTVINTLIATVIKARIQIATLQRQLKTAEKTAEIAEQNLQIIDRSYSNGRASLSDVVMARENLATAKAILPEIQMNLASAVQSLQILLAERPDARKNVPDSLSELPVLNNLPAYLPASLLDSRPDIAAAELRLKAQNKKIAVSIAHLYPDFTLTGNYGFRSEHFDNLMDNNFEIYSLVLNAAMPIWQGGQIRAGIKMEKAKFEELAYDYAQTVIQALKEVEGALVNEEKLKQQYQYLKTQLSYASQAEKLSFDRYSNGLEPLITFLESQRRRIAAENKIITVKSNLWINRVNLLLALGGKWKCEEAKAVDN